MARIPPWRRNLWKLWPPRETKPHRIPEEQIRPLAERLGKQRPWLSAQENWLAAERALRQKPWRPWVIRFSGEKERSGWDWADLLLKVSVPVLILGLSTAYSIISSSRQEKLAIADKERQEKSAREQRETDAITGFIKGMQPLLLDKDLKKSASDAEVRGVAKGLTLAALSQVQDPDKKRLIVRFLLDSGLNTKPGNIFSLSEANLRGANLEGVNLSWATLSRADLSKATLRRAKLRGANLEGVNLNGTNLSGTNYSEEVAFIMRSKGIMRSKDIIILGFLGGADLSEANLRGADLIKANISEANLGGADLSKANLSGANLRGADLSGANFWKANLSGANLSVPYLSGASLSEAIDLMTFPRRGANLRGANLRGADLTGANLSGAIFENTICPDGKKTDTGCPVPKGS